MEYQGSNVIGFEYEAQLFGFTPKSFVDGSKFPWLSVLSLVSRWHDVHNM